MVYGIVSCTFWHIPVSVEAKRIHRPVLVFHGVTGDGYHHLTDESKAANKDLLADHVIPMHQATPIDALLYDSCCCCLTEPYCEEQWVEDESGWAKREVPITYETVSFLLNRLRMCSCTSSLQQAGEVSSHVRSALASPAL